MDSPTCTFCAAAAALMPTEECRVCWPCAKRIAHLAGRVVPADVWDAPALASDENMEQLAARVADAVSPSDGDSHYTLAVAYREMGMHAGALREAATVLEHTDDVMKATPALRLILTAPLVRAGGLHSLRERLVRMAKN